MKMTMEYLNQSGMLTTPVPNLSLLDIAKAVKTQDGTWATDVPSINPFIEDAIPSVEFEDEYRARRIQEVDGEITAGRPCIPFIHLTDGIRHTWHAIVVSYINVEQNIIEYNDPGPPSPGRMKLSGFEKLWGDAATTLLKVQIGKNTRTKITEFVNPQ